jgi:hypothetical protein
MRNFLLHRQAQKIKNSFTAESEPTHQIQPSWPYYWIGFHPEYHPKRPAILDIPRWHSATKLHLAPWYELVEFVMRELKVAFPLIGNFDETALVVPSKMNAKVITHTGEESLTLFIFCLCKIVVHLLSLPCLALPFLSNRVRSGGTTQPCYSLSLQTVGPSHRTFSGLERRFPTNSKTSPQL